MNLRINKSGILLKGIIGFFVIGYIIYPLSRLLMLGFSGETNFHTLLSPPVLEASRNSMLLSLISVLGSAVVGVFFAYTFHYKRIGLKKIFSVLILLPIAIPPMVGVMAFLFLLGDNGLLASLTGWSNFHFSGWTAIIIIHIFSFYPLFYLFAGNALKSTDNSIVEAAHSLGAGKTKTFFSVILPQLKMAILSAALLTFMASMASFSAPFIFNGSQRFLTTEIYYAKVNGDLSLSALLSVLLTLISLTVLYIFNRLSKKTAISNKTKGSRKSNPVYLYQSFSYTGTLISTVFITIILLPVLSLIFISLLPDQSFTQPGLLNDISLTHYVDLFNESSLLNPLINSFEAAGVAVLVTAVLGMIAAHLIRNQRNWFTSITELFISIPYGIPGTVIAICLILGFNQPTLLSFNSVLIGTFWILPIAYTIRNIPILTQAIKSALFSLDPSLEEAAGSLGASKWKSWKTIVLPLIAIALLDGGMLVFINAFGEFVATVLLYNYDTQTMPIEIYAQMRMYNTGLAAAYGVLIFFIILTIIFLTKFISKKYLDFSSRN